MSDKKKVHIFLSGRVQGVGFRSFVRKNANKLNIKGWVKNLDDGRVEAIFSGNNENVNKLINLVKRGPSFAKVKNIEINEKTYNDMFTNFEIRF